VCAMMNMVAKNARNSQVSRANRSMVL